MAKQLRSKTVSESAIEDHVYKVFPNDLNSNRTVFGGLVMATLDRIASVVAQRHSGTVCVTASVDALNFLKPANEGDILIFKAAVNRTWRTSMEIGVKVVAEDFRTRETRHIVSAYLTFVGLDEKGQPTEVPAVTPETAIEKQRFKQADVRREHRRIGAELHRQGKMK